MEVRATLRNFPIGTRKSRLVADLVRDRSVDDALAVLQGCDKQAARTLKKLIDSAVANAQHMNQEKQAGIDLDGLYIKTITIDQGPHSWRIRARAMGRANWIRKTSSHATVVLAER
jgi:large subunit ribosomal protein L22